MRVHFGDTLTAGGGWSDTPPRVGSAHCASRSTSSLAAPRRAQRDAAFAPVPRRTPLYALYAADVVSLTGNAVAQLAIPWYVLTTTGSATLTALVVFFNFVTIVFAALFGGDVVDRMGLRSTSLV